MIKKSFIIQKKQSDLSCSIITAGYFKDFQEHGIKREGTSENILIYCVGGSGTVFQNNTKIKMSHGDMVIIKENTPHSYYADEKDPWTIYWVHFTGDLSAFFRGYDDIAPNGVLHIGYQPSIIHNFEEILNDLSKSFNKFSVSCANSRLVLTLSEFLSCIAIKSINYEMIIEYMKANIKSNISLDQLSELVSLSKYHFSRQFKIYTGNSPLEYFRHLKIAFACEKLSNTNDSVTSISEDMNYCSPYHFSEQFKAVTGYRPIKYREITKKIY